MVALDNVALSTANLTITGTKDLTGDNKKQVLFSLTTKEADGANNTALLNTFADLDYTSVVITAYKNGTDSTNPLEETPLFTRTLQGTQLNKAAINLDITHEATVGSESEFQANTSYVFEARFIKNDGGTISLELVRTVHLFQNAPNASDYSFESQVSATALGLTVKTAASAVPINEVFVEIIKLDGDEPLRDPGTGVISVYSLKKYQTDTSGNAFAVDTQSNAQVIRADDDTSLPNSTNSSETSLITAKAYNMHVIFVTNGGTSDKINVTTSGASNTSLLLASRPHDFKQTFIDEQKISADVAANDTNNTLAASVLQVLEITPLSTSEVLDRIAANINMDGQTKSLTSHAGYTNRTDGKFAAAFETDLVTSVSQGTGADAFIRKVIAIRYTKASSASNTTLTGTKLVEDDTNVSEATYPTKASGDTGFQDRLVAQVCTENITFYNNKPMGITSDSNKTLGTALNAGGTVYNVKVLYVQVTDLDFDKVLNNVSTTLSNSSDDTNSNAITKFVHRTNGTGTLVESDPASTTSLTTIKMDLQNNGTSFANNTLQVTQDELNAAGHQSFSLQFTTDLLSAFVDTSIIDFVQITLNDNSGTNSYKTFTLDTSTATGRPTAVNFLKGTHALTLTNNTTFGADADSTKADSYGVLPVGPGSLPPASLALKPYSTLQSIAFDAASRVSNVYVVVHLKGYNYGAQLFSGKMSLRYELGSLINNGSGNIVNYAVIFLPYFLLVFLR